VKFFEGINFLEFAFRFQTGEEERLLLFALKWHQQPRAFQPNTKFINV